MKFTVSWLKDHIETNATLNEIVATLTRIGLEVEQVEDPAVALQDFVIAKVVEAKPHPNADRLQVCIVDVGDGGLVQVVCGAPNARAGLKGVFAPVGSHIQGLGLTLTKAKIRGVESNGMLLSERDPQKLDRLASAQARLSEQERVLSGRPLPGSLKPGGRRARQPLSVDQVFTFPTDPAA